MRDGRAEQLGEGLVAGFVEVALAAEEDGLVGEERGADLGDGGGGQVAAEPYAADLGADAAADLRDGDGGDCSGHGNSLVYFRSGRNRGTGQPGGQEVARERRRDTTCRGGAGRASGLPRTHRAAGPPGVTPGPSEQPGSGAARGRTAARTLTRRGTRAGGVEPRDEEFVRGHGSERVSAPATGQPPGRATPRPLALPPYTRCDLAFPHTERGTPPRSRRPKTVAGFHGPATRPPRARPDPQSPVGLAEPHDANGVDPTGWSGAGTGWGVGRDVT